MLRISGIVLLLWLAHAAVVFLMWRVRRARPAAWSRNDALTTHRAAARRRRANGVISAVLLVSAAALAMTALSGREGGDGEAARAYARLMLDEAGDRFVILNGVADGQMAAEESARNRAAGRVGAESRLIWFRTDDAYRAQLVADVRNRWPNETNLWAAAQIGPAAFADAAYRSHPETFYAMTGLSTTLEKWTARWTTMAPYLKARGRFIPRMRQAFALEGNALGNRLQDEGRLKEAWKTYLRVYDEISPGDMSALVNLGGMLRRGYAAGRGTRLRIESALKDLKVGDASTEPALDGQTLIAWNNQMIRAHSWGDRKKAASIARRILSNPVWRSFVPANAVLGSVLAHEGDLASAEFFFKAALAGKGAAAPQPVVMNDYADMLRKQGRFDEAEALARRAVDESDGKSVLFKLKLAQILRDAGKNLGELNVLLARYKRFDK